MIYSVAIFLRGVNVWTLFVEAARIDLTETVDFILLFKRQYSRYFKMESLNVRLFFSGGIYGLWVLWRVLMWSGLSYLLIFDVVAINMCHWDNKYSISVVYNISNVAETDMISKMSRKCSMFIVLYCTVNLFGIDNKNSSDT